MMAEYLTVLKGYSKWTHVILGLKDGGISYKTEGLFQVNLCNPWYEWWWYTYLLQYWRVIPGKLMQSLIWMVVAFLTLLKGHSRWTHAILDMNDGDISYSTEGSFQVNSCNPWYEWWWHFLKYWRDIPGEVVQSLLWMMVAFLTVLMGNSMWTHVTLDMNDGGISNRAKESFHVKSHTFMNDFGKW